MDFKQLQSQVAQLQELSDGKDLQLRAIENDMQDVLTPSLLGSNITCTVAEMLMEVVNHIKEKGSSAKAIASKNRLMDLLDKTEALNTITTQLNKLKLINRELHANYQLLRVENKKMRQQLENIEKAENFGG